MKKQTKPKQLSNICWNTAFKQENKLLEIVEN